MVRENHVRIQLTREELETAIKQCCGIPQETKLEAFWIKSECLAHPQAVCGFSYRVEEKEHRHG